jgi:hypothetical protein
VAPKHTVNAVARAQAMILPVPIHLSKGSWQFFSGAVRVELLHAAMKP